MVNKTRGLNVSSIKLKNRSLILRLLRDRGPLSRREMALLSGLTPAAVTNLVNEMIDQGILKEVGMAQRSSKAGRRRILVDIDKERKYIIGLNISTRTTSVGVSDMDFNLLAHEEFDTGGDRSPAEFLNEISSRVMQMLWKQSITKDDVLGVGVGIVGSVDPESGQSNLAYGIWSQPVNIRRILEESLEIKVVVENNVRALAVSELSLQKHLGVSNLIFVKHSPGLGSAVIINQSLFYGSTDCAGEIGHMVIERGGPLCRCGQKGCLEALTSAEKMIWEVKELMRKGETPWLNLNADEKCLVMEEIVEAYEVGDVGVIRVVEMALEYLSLGIANVMKIFDPQRVILYGPLFKSDQIFQSILRKIDQLVPGSNSSSVVQLSALDSDNKIIGGLSLVLERLFFETGATSIGGKTA